MLHVHGEYSKYEAIREYKALKAVIQSRDFFYKWRQIYTVDMCVRIDYCNWILRSFGRSHITKQCAFSTAGAIMLPPFLLLRVDGRKRFEYATCGRELFSKTEENTSVLKNIRIRVDRAFETRIVQAYSYRLSNHIVLLGRVQLDDGLTAALPSSSCFESEPYNCYGRYTNTHWLVTGVDL